MKRHLAKPIEFELDEGSGKIGMSPLKINDLPELMELQSELASSMKGAGDDAVFKISKEMTISVTNLLRKSLTAGNPEIKEPEVIDEFIASNFIRLMPKLFEVNSLTSGRDRIKEEKVKKIKERLDGNIGAGASSK